MEPDIVPQHPREERRLAPAARALRAVARARRPTRAEASWLAVLTASTVALAVIGIAATTSALTPDRRRPFFLPVGSLESTLTPTRVVSLLGLAGVVVLGLRRPNGGRIAFATFATALALAIWGVNLNATFAPPSAWGPQWRTTYAPSGNLTEGLELAANLREGHGYKLDSGAVDTYRMPGYAALVAAAGAVAGAPPRDYRSVAAATIWLQLLLTGLAVGLFAYVAAGRFRRLVLLALVLAVVALPTNIQFSQADSAMFAAGLLVTAALLPFLDRARGEGARWRDVLLLHLAFAGYFLLRTDIALAWAAVSLIVHGRRWKHLLVWPALFVSLGVGYGVYAKANGSEFTFGTNNTGHVAFVGLWELPQTRFVWQPEDASYDRWISAHGYRYMGPGANAFAEKEILRFYATFPGYVATMAVNKAIDYFDSTSLDVNFQTTPFRSVHRFRVMLVDGGLWALAATILLALVVGYRRYQTALLGWAGLFVLPIFFFVQDESRFTLFTVASLAIAAIPLLLDGGFYRALAARRLVAAPLVLVLLVFWIFHTRIAGGLLDWEAFRYWTPVLDPSHSTLAVYRH